MNECKAKIGQVLCFQLAIFLFTPSSFSFESACWRLYTSVDGLQESWITSLSYCPYDRLWINHGDVENLSVYDGYSFDSVPTPGPTVRIQVNKEGQVWSLIPREAGGFQTLQEGQWIHYLAEEIESDSPFYLELRTPFYTPSWGNVIFLNDEDLLLFEEDNLRVRSLLSCEETALQTFLHMVIVSPGEIWLIGKQGLLQVFVRTDPKISVERTSFFPLPSSFTFHEIYHPRYTPGQGMVVVARQRETNQRVLLRFHQENWERMLADLDERFLYGWMDHEGNPWGIYGQENRWSLVYAKNGESEPVKKNKVFSGWLRDVMVGDGGHFWIATTTGLAEYTPPLWEVPQALKNIQKPCYSMVEATDGTLWFAFEDRLVSLREGQVRTYPYPQDIRLTILHIHSLTQWEDGTLVLGNPSGNLFLFHPEEGKYEIRSLPDNVYITFIARKDVRSVWVVQAKMDGTMHLTSYDGRCEKLVIEDFTTTHTGNVRAILQTTNGDIWTSGNTGIARYHEGDYESMGDIGEKNIGGAFSLLEVKENVIWAGGRDHIHEYEGKQWRALRSRHLETVRDMVQAENGTVWVASGFGVHQFRDGYWMSNTHKEGLPESSCNTMFVTQNQEVLVGSDLSVSRYYPQRDTKPPKSFIKNAESIAEISAHGNVIIAYDGRDRWNQTFPNQLLFSYRLDEEPWSPFAEKTLVTFHSMSPGKHTFSVRAIDRNMNIEPVPGRLDFTVLKPWYKQTLFLLIASTGLFLILLSVIYAVSRYFLMEKLVEERTARLTQANEKLQHEVAERIRTQKELEHSELHFRTFFQTTPDAILITRLSDGVITLVNDGYVRMTGYTREETMGQKTLDLNLWVDLDERQQYLEELQEKGSIDNFETRFRSKGGIIHTCLISSRVIQVDDVFYILSVTRDIDDLKHVEAALAEEKERLMVTLHSIGDGVITTDKHGAITLMNQVAEELTGWSEEEAKGKPIEEVFYIVNEFTREQCPNPVQQVIKSEKITGLANHTVLISRHGQERILSDSAAPIRDQEGDLIGVVLVFRDDTEKRKIEQNMIKAEKLESLGILAGGIAHDFNNLLTAIIGNISLARSMSQSNEFVRKRLDEAEKATFRSQDLTRQLLTFSKGGEPVKQTVWLENLVRDTASFTLRGSNVGCEFDIPDDLWAVDVDLGQIGQVFHNLMINADQAMPEGGVIILRMRNVHLRDEQVLYYPPYVTGDYLEIVVQDKGHGIEPENLEKIFDPYFTTKQKGSGLGLATTYSIIKRHDGFIFVDSKVGEGTTFSIYLPASGQAQEEIQDTSSTPILLGSGRILLMDDEESIRETAQSMLSYLGYEADTACEGEEMLEKYRQAYRSSQPYDAVILDLTVPGGMGGKEAISKLLAFHAQAKVIVSSGYATDPIISNYQHYGFIGFIPKPYKLDDLGKVLRDVLTT